MRMRFKEIREIDEVKTEKTLPVLPNNGCTMTTEESKKFWDTVFDSLLNGGGYDTAIQNARDKIKMMREVAQLPEEI